MSALNRSRLVLRRIQKWCPAKDLIRWAMLCLCRGSEATVLLGCGLAIREKHAVLIGVLVDMNFELSQA